MGSDISAGWNELVVTPDDEAVAELRQAWSWLLKENYRPVLFSALGDIFFESVSGEVHWLNTGTGDVSQVSENVEVFEGLLATDIVEELFLPRLVEELIAAGKVLKAGQCYSFDMLPVFKEGNYSVENLNPVSMKDHFSHTGSVHEEIRDLPDGTEVRLRGVD